MSQNKTKENKECVDGVTERTPPLYAHTSAYIESIKSRFLLQAEETVEEPFSGLSAHASELTSQTVSFIDNAEGEVIFAGSEVNAVAKVDNTEDLQLGSFFARPTLLNSFTWSTSDTIGVKTFIRPWQLFLSNTNIKKKLDNYAFLRAKLHIKVVVNGTPFQYGLLRACYSPLLSLVSDKIRTNPTSSVPLLIPYSQQPGLFITPAANAGGQMELPFFYHANWLDITSNTDVTNMGTINYVIFAPLAVAVSGGSTSVTVQTFAWMTDVELMGTTSKLSLQSDEYSEGPVSSVATAVANVAGYLTKIPRFAPFARATQIGAQSVGGIARIFGYTNVPVIADVHTFQPQNAPMLASAHIGTPVQKLTLDPKQELSLDPTLHGLVNADELTINNIKSKQSYFGATSWATTDVVDTLLFSMRVTPDLQGSVAINNSGAVEIGRRIYPTPLSYCSRMFANWRGSLKVRIKIVATKFHKGRLKISYDPVNDITSTNPDVNAVYTQIVDIGEEDDIEVEIPYHQVYPWLYTDRASPSDNWSPGGVLAPIPKYSNGVLTIRVLTTLTAPASGSVYILAFVSGGDDFEFANPTDHIGYETTHKVPSFFALQAEDITNVVSSKVTLGQPAKPHPDRYAQNFGEAILSLRNLLHRYMIQDTIWIESSPASSNTIIGKSYRIMPYTPGFDPNFNGVTTVNKVVAASGTAPYAMNQMHHMPYIAGMFLGYRGGANFNLTPGYDLYANQICDFRLSRWTTPLLDPTYRWWKTWGTKLRSATQSSRSFFINNNTHLNDSLSGVAITSTDTNASLTAQLPDFKLANFSLADPSNYLNGIAADGTDRSGMFLTMTIGTGASTQSDVTLQTHVSAAPDFTCLFWLCCPTMDYLQADPTPI